MTNIGRDFWDELSERALESCTPYFNEQARLGSVALATMLRQFDGSMLSLVILRRDPACWPNPDKVAYLYMSDVIHREATMAMQRNYFTSAANKFLPRVAHRGPRVSPAREGTHDRVCRYTSKYFGQTDHPVEQGYAEVIRELLANPVGLSRPIK